MSYSQGDYSKHYITEALFKLMEDIPYKDVTVIDITKKAGVGRATFYRYFNCKEDVLYFFFERAKSEFSSAQLYSPRSVNDYMDIIRRVVDFIRKYKRRLQLLVAARLEYIYTDFVNAGFAAMTENGDSRLTPYTAAGYAGAITNITLQWVKSDCKDDEEVVFDAFKKVTFGDPSSF